MPLDHRPYMQAGRPYGGGYGFSLPRPPRVTLGLILACAAVFLLGISPGLRAVLHDSLSLPSSKPAEVWRLITFQFVHAGSGHFLWNMIGLYFFAPPLERAWGGRRFLAFYLFCGVFAGVCYLLLSLFVGAPTFLVGASGGILACLMACAILYPHFLVIIFPIRWVAGFYALFFFLGVVYERDLSGAAHLGGMVAGAIWLWVLPRAHAAGAGLRGRLREGAWQRKLQQRQAEQEELDRILQKIHDQGLGSLSPKECRTLQQASRRQRDEQQKLRRL
ncbi:MAG: rhomboid family intramembrane serine protease [Phycisphaerae bacterium]|nr:rhomboid family intramembrane serine protease [Phycisphaerae bacterium]